MGDVVSSVISAIEPAAWLIGADADEERVSKLGVVTTAELAGDLSGGSGMVRMLPVSLLLSGSEPVDVNGLEPVLVRNELLGIFAIWRFLQGLSTGGGFSANTLCIASFCRMIFIIGAVNCDVLLSYHDTRWRSTRGLTRRLLFGDLLCAPPYKCLVAVFTAHGQSVFILGIGPMAIGAALSNSTDLLFYRGIGFPVIREGFGASTLVLGTASKVL